MVGLSVFLLPPICRTYRKQKNETEREQIFYELSCFLTGFDQLDRTMNRYVLLEMDQLFQRLKIDKILHLFTVHKDYAFLKSSSVEFRLFQEKLLRIWYSGSFHLKGAEKNLVALGYLNNLTWASYTIPAPGISVLNWGNPILSRKEQV
jgi:hypothetical protein